MRATTATITRPTYEEAPARLGAWLKQRTRWYKGWLQTTLVHLRQPGLALRQLGPHGALGAALTTLGMVVSVAIHPVYWLLMLHLVIDPLVLWRNGGFLESCGAGVTLFILVGGYVAPLFLGVATSLARGRVPPVGAALALPFYLLLMSLASYRAIWQLFFAPHLWEKTPHEGRRRESRKAGGARAGRAAVAPAGE